MNNENNHENRHHLQQQQQRQQQQARRHKKAISLQHKTTKLNNSNKRYYPQWHNLVAGGVAGAGSRLLTAPLDLLRIRRQLQTVVEYPRPTIIQSLQRIAKREGGYQALFRGSVAATYLWIGYSAVQFTLYGRVQHYLEDEYYYYYYYYYQNDDDGTDRQHQLAPPPNPAVISFISGAAAGLCATIATYPFDICRTIFAARGISTTTTSATATAAAVKTSTAAPGSGSISPPKSLSEFALVLYQQRGVRAFYAGCGPAVIQIIPYMGLNFALYDTMTRGDKSSFTSSIAGMISGATSKIIVYPLDTVKKRLQAQAAFGVSDGGATSASSSSQFFHKQYTGMMDCIATMIQTEGIASFYRGLVPSVLKTSLATGLTFGLYRMSKNILESIQDNVISSSPPTKTPQPSPIIRRHHSHHPQ